MSVFFLIDFLAVISGAQEIEEDFSGMLARALGGYDITIPHSAVPSWGRT